MSITLVDTNVLLDLVTLDPVWAPWSEAQLNAGAARGRLSINEIVYAELSVRAPSIEHQNRFLDASGIEVLATPQEALFLAGKAFARYKARGGGAPGILPDFFIGAQAAVLELPLLTRDARYFRSYFPAVTLITP